MVLLAVENTQHHPWNSVRLSSWKIVEGESMYSNMSQLEIS